LFFDLDTVLISNFICNEFLRFACNKSMTIFLISSNPELLNEFSDQYRKATPQTLEDVFMANMPMFLQQDFFDAVKAGPQNKEYGEKICNVLYQLCISEKHLGYAYIKESILLILANKSNLKSLSKTVFPTVAAKYQTNVANIERSIRTAIKNFNPDCFKRNHNIVLPNDTKFTAKKFVAFVVNLIE